MKKNITFLTVILTLFIVSSSCERDEICIDPITPKLSIAFYDAEDPELPKSVNNLAVEIYNVAINDKSLDTLGRESIAVPLNVYDTQTFIVLTTDSKNPEEINQDTIRISYAAENVFVGRSCGYKTIFKNVTFNTDFSDNDKWIQSLFDSKNEIVDETTAHVKILH